MKKYSQHIHEAKEETFTLQVEISNLTKQQVEEVTNFLCALEMAGSLGCSREFSCDVDGDGAFRPGVLVNGKGVKECNIGSNVNFDKSKLSFGFN
jgi:hypothetical protein